jgi:hypothetical protein
MHCGNASAAAEPKGRSSEAATDVAMNGKLKDLRTADFSGA